MGITKKELKYILYSLGFSVAWFLVLIPFLLKKGVEQSNVYFQFAIFYVGIFVFIQIFLKAKASGQQFNLRKLFGIIGLILLFIALDTIAPPFLVSSSGELKSSAILEAAAPDYVIGYLATSIGLTGVWVYIFTYVLFPAVLLLVSAQLLQNLIREI